MNFKPEEDGRTHINVYSQGQTPLGKYLSNFTQIKNGLQTPDGMFASVEGYWYWLNTNPAEPKREQLRKLYGFKAKQVGRELRAADWNETQEFQEKIKAAIRNKVMMSPGCVAAMKLNELPYVHYYVFQEKVVVPEHGKWIWDFITELGQELKTRGE